MIVIVLALIVIVAYSIFSSGEEKATSTPEPKTEEKQTNSKDDKAEDNTEKQTEDKQSGKEDDDDKVDENKEDDSDSEEADDSEAIVTAGDGTSNVLKTIENPSWKPVGTEQSGVHNPVYDDTSVDWQEMLKAISYATGLDQSTMTVYWLGRDQSATNGSVGTVYSKETQEKYRVFIQWVDGQGWMPTKVEELSELER